MAKKLKTDRACGYCQKKTGHNARTCEVRKADLAKGVIKETGADSESNEVIAAPNSSSTALVSTVPPENRVFAESGRVHPAHAPHEFEEARKQVHANGTTMSAAMREYAAGATSIALRFQDESDEKPVEKILDIEKAGKLYELLGWCLQRQAARNSAKTLPTARANGLAARQSTAEPR